MLDARRQRARAPPPAVDGAAERRQVGLAGELAPAAVQLCVLGAQLPVPAVVLQAVGGQLRVAVAAVLERHLLDAPAPPARAQRVQPELPVLVAREGRVEAADVA